MRSILLKLLHYIMKAQEDKHKKRLEKALPKSALLSSASGSKKTHMTSFANLSLTSKLEKDKEKLEARVKEVVKKNLGTPEELLTFIEKNKTKVYKIRHADKILEFAGEQEGFITPLKGFRALFLNVILERKIAFETQEMFVLRDLPLNIYFMAHQFHKWYGYKMKLPGFEEVAQKNFKRIWEFENSHNVSTLRYEEIIALKEAIARDVEAIDFVLNLAREGEGSQKAYRIMTKEGGATI